MVTAVPSEAISSPAATPIPLPALSPQEEELTHWLREDVSVDCRPRRTDLPDEALIGAECFPNHDLVARVGIYEFATDQHAAQAYIARMAIAGVTPETGRCWDGIPGDHGWLNEGGGGPIDEADGILVDGQIIGRRRAGCFHDENGMANFRMTCWEGMYIGVLGRTRDIGALTQWVEEYPADIPVPAPGPPGICPYEPGLGELEEPLAPGDTP